MKMTKTFMMKLDKIQPSELYISSEKLGNIVRSHEKLKLIIIEPVPIKRLGSEIVFVEGHTRAFAALLRGLSEIPVFWEDEELDWDLYEICVKWRVEEGIHRIEDLESRIVSQQEYEVA